jgi:hypothetical protein
MKKLLFAVWLAFTFILSACGASATEAPIDASSNGLAMETRLAVGTLKLAGSEHDITAEQAQELVVLWQVYKELSQSDIAAQAEVDGLISQIRETMSSDQLQAIMDMQLTQQDVFMSMQGVTAGSDTSDGDAISVPSEGSTPAGGPPADGGGAPMDGGMPPDMGGAAPSSSTDQSQAAQAGSGLESLASVPSALADAVIQSLQEKMAASF